MSEASNPDDQTAAAGSEVPPGWTVWKISDPDTGQPTSHPGQDGGVSR